MYQSNSILKSKVDIYKQKRLIQVIHKNVKPLKYTLINLSIFLFMSIQVMCKEKEELLDTHLLNIQGKMICHGCFLLREDIKDVSTSKAILKIS